MTSGAVSSQASWACASVPGRTYAWVSGCAYHTGTHTSCINSPVKWWHPPHSAAAERGRKWHRAGCWEDTAESHLCAGTGEQADPTAVNPDPDTWEALCEHLLTGVTESRTPSLPSVSFGISTKLLSIPCLPLPGLSSSTSIQEK